MRLGRNAKVDLIRKVPLFAHCSRGEIAEVASIADEIDVSAGKELTQEGDRGREFFVLLEGAADVRRNGRKLNALGPGDFFGEIALVSRSPRTATVTTTEDSRLLVVTATSFRALLDHSPRIQIRVLEALADRLAPTAL
ncbi:MAG: cyclic nucleotide-binding domain-containing protein [Gaiellaceae bacterium MAG52_C11]|nr:cyclic nucleotide-binding domain-containing protein [Candidatus Gaiellasilicea maunaloa]